MLLTIPSEIVAVDATEIIDDRASTGPSEQYDNLTMDGDGLSVYLAFGKET